jgi:hypothetical protein
MRLRRPWHRLARAFQVDLLAGTFAGIAMGLNCLRL